MQWTMWGQAVTLSGDGPDADALATGLPEYGRPYDFFWKARNAFVRRTQSENR